MRLWVLLPALLGGCSDPQLLWRVELADGIDRDAVALVRVEVARGSCDSPGDVVFATEIERDAQPAMQPGALGEGPHAFRAVAVDLACRIVGRGCADVSLPRGGAVVTTVEPSAAEDACDGAACDGAGRCGADGGPPDAGLDATSDAGLDATSDAGCAGPACDELVPSNVPAEWIDPDAGPVSIAGDVLVDTSSCTAAGLGVAASDVRVHAQDSGPELCVIAVGDLTVSAGVSVRVTGARPLVILASGEVRIAGDVDLAARHEVPGAGGAPGGWGDGGGPAAGTMGGSDGEERTSGGGGGGLCGAGGAGGASGPGEADGDVPVAGGAGGGAIAPVAASPLLGGSSGGSGAPLAAGGFGGAGGGALQITALGAILVGGVIDVSGGGGGGGGTRAPPLAPSGGGGGSGGMVLLESPVIRFEPSAMIRAAGGGGGGAAGGRSRMVTEGGAGEDGRLAGAGRAAGGIGGGSVGERPGEPGGAGGGAEVLDGDPGGSARRLRGDGGGGGGGAGCIVLRTGDGEAPENLATNPTSIEVLPIRTE